jgi:hypothetical protein
MKNSFIHVYFAKLVYFRLNILPVTKVTCGFLRSLSPIVYPWWWGCVARPKKPHILRKQG